MIDNLGDSFEYCFKIWWIDFLLGTLALGLVYLDFEIVIICFQLILLISLPGLVFWTFLHCWVKMKYKESQHKAINAIILVVLVLLLYVIPFLAFFGFNRINFYLLRIAPLYLAFVLPAICLVVVMKNQRKRNVLN